ncbi:MAG: hypothetical protein NZL93_01860, partial [Chthoniobacterales bacterium]|nr:hypothetical protein [Chthoniobacterales bacterium]
HVREFTSVLKLGIFCNFLDGGFSVVYVAETVFTECYHSLLDSLLSKDNTRCAFVDEFADGIGHFEEFEKTFSAFVTGLVADFTSFAEEEVFVANIIDGKAKSIESGFCWFVSGAAGTTNSADEALGEDCFESCGNEEGLDAHILEPGECPC